MRGALTYVIFGLAVYYIGSFVALIRARRAQKNLTSYVKRDFIIVYCSSIILAILEVFQTTWDYYHKEHIPSEISTCVLLSTLLPAALASYRIYKHRGEFAIFKDSDYQMVRGPIGSSGFTMTPGSVEPTGPDGPHNILLPPKKVVNGLART